MTRIYPRPQWLQKNDDEYLMDDPLTIAAANPIHRRTAELLASRLGETFGVSTEVRAGGPASIQLGSMDDPVLARGLQARGVHLGEDVQRPEGYVLDVGPAGALVAGFDAAATFHGSQSLLQIVQSDGQSLRLPGMTVRDWPYKRVRGMHLYMPGRAQIPFFKRLLTWLASLKYNTLFLEVGGGMRFDRHPEINRAWERFCAEAEAYPGGPIGLQSDSTSFWKNSTHTELGGGSFLEKAEVADLLALAQDLHMEVVPEVQALSHSYYLCGAYPEIAERADDPYPDTFCPSNPRTYEIFFDVMEEVVELFQPRTVHIGHDEVYHMGLCPRCQDKTGSELLAYELERIYGFLAERGIGMAMWCDKLLPMNVGGQGGVEIVHEDPVRGKYTRLPETYKAIDSVPRDVLITEWRGNNDPSAADFLLGQGFPIVCGNFGGNFAPMQFQRWHQRSADKDIIGGEVPSWCDNSAFALGYNGCLFRALFAPQMLWWSHYRDLDREAVLREVAELTPAARKWLGGEALPSGRAGAGLTPLPLGAAPVGQPSFAAQLQLPDDTPFSLDPGHGVIQVDGQNPSVHIPVDRRLDSLLLLHTCITEKVRRPTWYHADQYHHPADNVLAIYRVGYADGAQEEFPIHYGSHVARWDVPYGEHMDAVPFWADPLPVGFDQAGRRVTLYRYEWVNPRPDVSVAGMTLEYTGDSSGALWLFAATVVTNE